jgi:hypothetical protein
VRPRERGKRLERELETVGLGLVPAEKEHGAAAGGPLRRREARDVDGVVEDLPGATTGSCPFVGRPLAELALVEDVVGGGEQRADRPVDLLRVGSRPARIPDAVLVDDERDVPASQVHEKRAQVLGHPVRPEVGDREVPGIVREPRRQALDLRGPSGDGLAWPRHAVVAVEDAHARGAMP